MPDTPSPGTTRYRPAEEIAEDLISGSADWRGTPEQRLVVQATIEATRSALLAVQHNLSVMEPKQFRDWLQGEIARVS